MKALIIFAKSRGASKSPLILIFTYSSMYFQSAQAEIQKNTQNFRTYICTDFLKQVKERMLQARNMIYQGERRKGGGSKRILLVN